MAFLFAAVSARVDATSSSVSRAAAELGVVSSRDCGWEGGKRDGEE